MIQQLSNIRSARTLHGQTPNVNRESSGGHSPSYVGSDSDADEKKSLKHSKSLVKGGWKFGNSQVFRTLQKSNTLGVINFNDKEDLESFKEEQPYSNSFICEVYSDELSENSSDIEEVMMDKKTLH